MMPEATQGSPSADGRYWAYIKNTDPTDRENVAFKRYRGGGMPSIWIFDTKTQDIQVVPGERCNDVKPLWLGDKVYFLSARDKIVNVFSYDVKTKKGKQVNQLHRLRCPYFTGPWPGVSLRASRENPFIKYQHKQPASYCHSFECRCCLQASSLCRDDVVGAWLEYFPTRTAGVLGVAWRNLLRAAGERRCPQEFQCPGFS